MAIVNSIQSNFVITKEPISAPTGLGATTVSDTEISLDWTDATYGPVEVQRSLDDVSFDSIATVDLGVQAYDDTGLAPSTTYYYRIRVVSLPYGNSAFTASESATTDA